MPREVVQLTSGKQVIALKFAKGKEYGERFMFSTACDRILYLDREDAKELERLDIGVKVPFTVSKRNGQVEFGLLNGTAVQSAAPVAGLTQTDDTPGGITPALKITPVVARLMASYMAAVDTLLETQVYAHRKGLVLAVTCEDVRCCAATIFIDGAR